MPEQSHSRTILGINYSGHHDSSVAVLDHDYRLRFAVSEERFTRFKKDGRFPIHALNYVSKHFSGIQAIGLASQRQVEEPDRVDRFWHDARLLTSEYAPVQPFHIDETRLLEYWDVPIYTFGHHLCHAQAGFYLSGFSEALILTCDGGMHGCPWNAGIYSGQQDKGVEFISGRLQSTYVQIVRLYSDVTAILGFRPNIHEGKITGLAARGKANEACEQALLDLELTMNHASTPLYFWVGAGREDIPASLETNQHLAANYRKQLGEFSNEDIAHAVQRITEQRIVDVVRRARTLYASPNLVLAGGLFANVRINLECKRAGFEKIFICPPMGDDGLCVGAAILAAAELDQAPPPVCETPNLYLGPETEAEALPAYLNTLKVNYQRPEALQHEIAKALADGRTVARVAGRMEFGPRALGHRTIYYQPTDPSVNDWLNQKLRRSEFMPFAPIVRAENAPQLFEELEGAELTARFMTICLPCKEIMKELCPAVIHVDGTARPQLVDPESAPDAYEILKHYEALTGLPALINTSFNVHDEPIVNSWRDAIVAFFQSELDVLALEDLLITREDNATFAAVAALWSRDDTRIERALRREANATLGLQAERMGHYNEELKKAKSWLEGEVARQAQAIQEWGRIKAYHDQELALQQQAIALLQQKTAKLEQDLQSSLRQATEAAEAGAHTADALRAAELKLIDLTQSQECLECKLRKRDKYIVELFEAKDDLSEVIEKKDKYIAELLDAKQYLDGELKKYQSEDFLPEEIKKKNQYIMELLDAKQYLDGELRRKDDYIKALLEAKTYLEDEIRGREENDGEMLHRQGNHDE